MEAAVLYQSMVRLRLVHGKVMKKLGSTMTGFDAANAFMSVNHDNLDKLMGESFADEHDEQFMQDRCNGGGD